jgi:peptidyl-prolyl cis-trans isomerase SurA
MQRFFAVLGATFLVQGLANAQTRELATKGELLDRVAAVVNDGVVLSSELDEQIVAISERLRTQKLELPPQNVLRQQVLERLVLEQIQLQRADKAGMKIPDEALNNALQEVAQQNHIELSKLPEALAAAGHRLPLLPHQHAQGADAEPAAPARCPAAHQRHAA